MSKHDWVFVGVRLFGVYLLVEFVFEMPKHLHLILTWDINFWWFVNNALQAWLCWLLAFQTSTFCRWLGQAEAE